MQYRDPVCGMMVDSNTAAAEASHGSQKHYFCSTACRDRFEANPAEYLAAPRDVGAGQKTKPRSSGPEMERHEPPRTVSGPIAAPKFGSAGSGGAEYEPIPEQHED